MMKTKIILFIMAALLMGGTTMAQHRHRGNDKKSTPKERAECMTERMVKEFSLTDAQKQQLLELNQQWMEQMGDRPHMGPKPKMKQKKHREACKDSTACKVKDQQRSEARKAQMEKMQTDRKAYDAKLQQILTKEQYAAYTQKMKERKGRQGKR